MKKKNTIKTNFDKKSILEKGEKLYPISKTSDEKCANLYKIENWAETFYHLKEGKSKDRYIELIKKTEYSTFFEGLNYEYGINKYPLNIEKAFKIYKQGANNLMDTMSMYRMYHIYKNDFKKFKILKRCRIYEKFYLFKCFSYLRFPQSERNEELCNRFDIYYETMIHFIEEDEELKIFPKFIKFLNENYKLYDINKEDLLLIEPIITYNVCDDFFKKSSSIEKLNNLALSKKNLEAYYKLTCFLKEQNKKETEQRFQFLYDKKYFRSYIDYALYLNTEKRYKEALEILKIAKENGFLSAGFLYYDIYLENNDFSLIIKEAVDSSFSKECTLYKLFQILIDDILIEKVYSFFEYIFFRKICIKHYGLKKEFDLNFKDFTNEIVNFLVKITDPKDTKKKKKIEKYYFRNDSYQELHLACGSLYFYGIKDKLDINNQKSLDNFIISNNAAKSDSYKRFVSFFIYKVRKRILEEQKLKESNANKNNNSINGNELSEFEKKLFNMYYSSLSENISHLSSSYFYYLSRLLNKKIGNNGNKLLEYLCLKKASEYKNLNPGSGSIISLYRKHKSKILISKYKDEYEKEFNNIKKVQDSEGYGDDGSICPICYENKRNSISLLCMHLLCNFCIEKVEKCPICRKNILMKYFIE